MPVHANLIPHFIHERYKEGALKGSFEAATVFVDLSGFTRLADEYAQAGKEGAERLADTLHAVFNPLLKNVYANGGFVTSFAGDAFIAVFPEKSDIDPADSVLHRGCDSASFICHAVESICQSRGIALGVRVGLSMGEVNWGIIGKESPYAFYFRGGSIAESIIAQRHASSGQIIAPIRLRSHLKSDLKGRKIRNALFCRLPARPIETGNEYHGLPLLRSGDIGDFIPEAVINLEGKAEFRDVAPVFLSFRHLPDYDEIQEIVVQVMSICKRLGGYFAQIEFGDKGCIFVLLFGAPVAYERNADRAVEFILACREKIDPIGWRAGSAYGTVWTGIRGSTERCEYAAIGDVMNIAARLAMQASWGDVLISRSLKNSLKRHYSLHASGSMKLKGRRRQTDVFLVGDARGAGTTSPYMSDIIGRQIELNQLKHFLHPILEGHFAGIAHIHGEAGAGKSRLIYELRRSFNNANASRTEWIICPVDEVLHLPLHPIRQGMKRLFEQFEIEGIESKKDRFSSLLRDCISDVMDSDHPEARKIGVELERIGSVLGALVDLHWDDSFYEKLDPKLRFENTISAVRFLLKARSILHPVVLLVEDVHWLDEESSQLLRRLPFGLQDFRVAFLFTSRYRDDGSRISVLHKNEFRQIDIELANLTGDHIDLLAYQILGDGVSNHLRESIRQRTAGNPLFIEQLILHLKAEDFLDHNTRGEWDLKDCDITVPSRIGEILVARLDRLPGQIRDLVQRAAVLGREFDTRVLVHMYPELKTVYDWIRRAKNEGIWSISDGTRYSFHHVLMRDAAYDMQTSAMKRNLHASAITALEMVHGNDLTGIYADLVHHCHEAGDIHRERTYSLLAGKESLSRFANDDADRYFLRALDLTPTSDLIKRFEILSERFSILETQGRREEQDNVLKSMTNIVEDLDDDERRVEVLYRKSLLALRRADYPAVISFAQETIYIAEICDSYRGQVLGFDCWARAEMFQGDYAQARTLLKKGLAVAESAHIPEADIRLRNVLGIVANYEGDRATALGHYRDVLRIAREQDRKRTELAALTNIGNLYAESGEYISARSYHENAVHLAREIGEMTSLGGSLTNLGNVLDSLGDGDGALRCYHEALDLCRETENHFGEGNTLGNLGMVASGNGEFEKSLFLHREALKIFQRIGYRWGEAWIWENIAGNAVSLGIWEDVDTYCGKALAIYQDLGDRRGEAMVYRWLVLSSLFHGNNEHAELHAERALTIAREIDDAPVLGAALISFGRVATVSGRTKEAIEALGDAISLHTSREEEHLCVEPFGQLCQVFMRERRLVESSGCADEIERILSSDKAHLVQNPIDAYYAVFLVRRSTNDENATGALRKARAILDQRADSISDEALRRSYLTNHAVHMSILELTSRE